MLPLPRGAVWQIFFLLCAVLLANEVRSEGRVVCYYTNWSVYRPGTAKFNPQNINPYLCTHLIYAFGGFTKDNTMKPFDKYQDIEQGGYAKFTGLKTYNKQLKTLIAIGGWNEASSRFSPLVASAERRQQFIKNTLKFLRQNHFDGLDLDWEYPAHRDGGKARDKDNYAQFVQELRAEFDRESSKTGRPRLLITMAVPAGIQYIEKGYDIPKLNKYLDWFNLLTYDFHSSHEPAANHHAPLYSMEEDDEYNFDSELNIDYSVKFYLDAGADRDKLVLGIPTYGRSYTLFNEDSTDLGAPADGPGEQGDATREKGYLAYYEICQNIKEDPDWHVVQPNPKAMGPYAYKGNQWVGYDDEAIVRRKAEYVVDNKLGGIMFWAIDNDDFRGTCTGKPYPLIEAAKETYLDHLGLGDNEVAKPSSKKKPSRSRSRIGSSNRNKVEEVVEKAVSISRKRPATRKRPQTERSTTTTTSTSSSLYVGGRTTTPAPPTTPDPGSDFKCEDEGFFQHPRDCKKYFWCLDSGPSNLGIVAHQFTCPSGLYFNPAADSCDFARNVPCNKNPKEPPSTTSKPSTTTTTTARTTTSPSKFTAATSRNTFSRYTSTTQAPEEYDEDYEVDVDDAVVDSEEDPRVIKELIDLIKKVGGIEELEKHLLQQEDGTVMLKKDEFSSNGATTTPASISKSLYDKVLSRPNNLNAFRNKFTSSTLFRSTSKPKTVVEEEEDDDEEEVKNTGSRYSSVVRNSRPGPQNAGIDKLPEFEGFLKEKKKYVTIQRTKPPVSSGEVTEDEDEVKNVQQDEEEDDDDDDDDDEVIISSSSRRPTSSSTPAYVSIRRTKSTTVKPAALDDDVDDDIITDKKVYAPLNRNRVRSTTDVTPSVIENTTVAGNRYKFLERTRPTRRPSVTVTPKEDIDEESDESEGQLSVTVQYSEQNEISTQSPTQQAQTTTRAYASIGRRTTTTTTTTDQAPITTTPESFVIDTTTPEPIIITTTTTTTNPISIETSTQSSTTTTIPILAFSASTLSPSTSQDDENATIAPKNPSSLATESGLDTQELDSTQNQILTETTTIDDTDKNEVTNPSTTKTTTSNKSQSSLNNNSSSNNSIRGSLSNKFTGGGRRQQQKQKTTTSSTTIDTNQQQETSTNEFLGTVSSPRPFGFPRRRTRPTTTTTTDAGGLGDAESSSTETATPTLVKKVSSTPESYLRSRSRLSQNVDRAQNVNGGTSLVVDHVAKVVDSLVEGNRLGKASEDGLTKTRTYSWKDARNPNIRQWKHGQKEELEKLAISQYYDWQVAQGARRDDEGYSQAGDWQKIWGQDRNPTLSYRDGSRYGYGTGVGLNGVDRFAGNWNSGNWNSGDWNSGKYVPDDSGKWRATSLGSNEEGGSVFRRGYGTGGQDVLSTYQGEDSSVGEQNANRGFKVYGDYEAAVEGSSGDGYEAEVNRGDERYTWRPQQSGASQSQIDVYGGWNGHSRAQVTENGEVGQVRYRVRGQQDRTVLEGQLANEDSRYRLRTQQGETVEGSGDEANASHRLHIQQNKTGQSHTEGGDGKHRVRVNQAKTTFEKQSQENTSHRIRLQQAAAASEGESNESLRTRNLNRLRLAAEEEDATATTSSSNSQNRLEGAQSQEGQSQGANTRQRVNLQQGAIETESETEESTRRKNLNRLGTTTGENVSELQDQKEQSLESGLETSEKSSEDETTTISNSQNEESFGARGSTRIRLQYGSSTSEYESENSARRRLGEAESQTGQAIHRIHLQQGDTFSENESEESVKRRNLNRLGTTAGEEVSEVQDQTERSLNSGLDSTSQTTESPSEDETTTILNSQDEESLGDRGSTKIRLQGGSPTIENESQDSIRSRNQNRVKVVQSQTGQSQGTNTSHRVRFQQGGTVLESESEESIRRKNLNRAETAGEEISEVLETTTQTTGKSSEDDSTTVSSSPALETNKNVSREIKYHTLYQQPPQALRGESEGFIRRKNRLELAQSQQEDSANTEDARHGIHLQSGTNDNESSDKRGYAIHKVRLHNGSSTSEGASQAQNQSGQSQVTNAIHRIRLQQGGAVSETESEESIRRRNLNRLEITAGEEVSEVQDQTEGSLNSGLDTTSQTTEAPSEDETTTILNSQDEESLGDRGSTKIRLQGGSSTIENESQDTIRSRNRNRVKVVQSQTGQSQGTNTSHRVRFQQGGTVSERESEESIRRKNLNSLAGTTGEEGSKVLGSSEQSLKSDLETTSKSNKASSEGDSTTVSSSQKTSENQGAYARRRLRIGTSTSEDGSQESIRTGNRNSLGAQPLETNKNESREIKYHTLYQQPPYDVRYRTRLEQSTLASEGESQQSIRGRNKNRLEAAAREESSLDGSKSSGGTTSTISNSSALQTTEAQVQDGSVYRNKNINISRGSSKFGADEDLSSESQIGTAVTSDRGDLLYKTVQVEGVSQAPITSSITSDRGNALFKTIHVEGSTESVSGSTATAERGDVLNNTDQVIVVEDPVQSSIPSDRGDSSYNRSDSNDNGSYNSSHYGSGTILFQEGTTVEQTGLGSQDSTTESLDGTRTNVTADKSKTEAITTSIGTIGSLNPLGATISGSNTTSGSGQYDIAFNLSVLNGTRTDSESKKQSSDSETSVDAQIEANVGDYKSRLGTRTDAGVRVQTNDGEYKARPGYRGFKNTTSSEDKDSTHIRGIISEGGEVNLGSTNEVGSSRKLSEGSRLGSTNSLTKDETQTGISRNVVGSFKFGTGALNQDNTKKRKIVKILSKNDEDSNTETITIVDSSLEADIEEEEAGPITTTTTSRIPSAFTSRTRSGSARRTYNTPSTQLVTRQRPRVFTYTKQSESQYGTGQQGQTGTKQTIIRNEGEVDDETNDEQYDQISSSTTRRPKDAYRGSFRPKFNDLSSLLAIDFHRKHQQTTTSTEGPRLVVRRRRPVHRATTEAPVEEEIERSPRPTRPPRTTTTTEAPKSTTRPTSSFRRVGSGFTRKPTSDTQEQQVNYAVRRKIIRNRIQGDSATGSGVSSTVNTGETVSEDGSLRRDQLAIKNAILNLLNGTQSTGETNGTMLSESEVKVDFEEGSGTTAIRYYKGSKFQPKSKFQTNATESSTGEVSTGSVTESSAANRNQIFRNRFSSTSVNEGIISAEEVTTEVSKPVNPTIPRGKSRLNLPDLSSLLSPDFHSKRRFNATVLTKQQSQLRPTTQKTINETTVTEGDTTTTTTVTKTTTHLVSPGNIIGSGRAFDLRKTIVGGKIRPFTESTDSLQETTTVDADSIVTDSTVIDTKVTEATTTQLGTGRIIGSGRAGDFKKTLVGGKVTTITEKPEEVPAITDEIIVTMETGLALPTKSQSGTSRKTSYSSVFGQSNELLGGEVENPTVPIYTRRKYYKYLTDSPIIYIGKVGSSSEASAEGIEEATTSGKEDINKAILAVFDVYNHSRLAAAAKDQEKADNNNGTTVYPQDTPPRSEADGNSIAHEINSQLDNFLVSAPRTAEDLGATEASSIEDISQTTQDEMNDEILKLALEVNSMSVGGPDMTIEGSGETSVEIADLENISTGNLGQRLTTEKVETSSRRSFGIANAIEINAIARESEETTSPATTRRTLIHEKSEYDSTKRRPFGSRQNTTKEPESGSTTTFVPEPRTRSYFKLNYGNITYTTKKSILPEESTLAPTTRRTFTGRTTAVPTISTGITNNDEASTELSEESARTRILSINQTKKTGDPFNEETARTILLSLNRTTDNLTEEAARTRIYSIGRQTIGFTGESEEAAKTDPNIESIVKIEEAPKAEEEEATVIPSLDDFESLTTISPAVNSGVDLEPFTIVPIEVELEADLDSSSSLAELTSPSDNQSAEPITESHRTAKTFIDTTIGSDRSSSEQAELDEFLEAIIDEDEELSTIAPKADGQELVRTSESGSFSDLKSLNERRRQQISTEPSIEATTQGFNRRRTTTKPSEPTTAVLEESITSSTPTRRRTPTSNFKSVEEDQEAEEEDSTSATTENSLSSTRRTFAGFNRLRTTTASKLKDEDEELTAEIDEALNEIAEINEDGDIRYGTTTLASVQTPSTRRSFSALSRLRTTAKPEAETEEIEETSTVRRFPGINRVRISTTVSPDDATSRSFISRTRLRTSSRAENKEIEAEEEKAPTPSTTRRGFSSLNRLRITTTERPIPEDQTEEDIEDTTNEAEEENYILGTTRRTLTGFNRLRTNQNKNEENTTRRTFGVQKRVRIIGSRTSELLEVADSNTEIETKEEEEDEENEITPSTRRTFTGFNRSGRTRLNLIQPTESPDENAGESTASILVEESTAEGSTRRTFNGFNRLRTTTTSVPKTSETTDEPEEDLDENLQSEKEASTTRRTFNGFNRLRTTTVATTEGSEVPEEETSTELGTTPSTRRTFSGFNRLRTTTTATTEASETAEESVTENIDTSTVGTATTRRTFAGFNRLRTTTEASEASGASEEETTGDLEYLDENTTGTTASTRRTFAINRLRTTTTTPTEGSEAPEEETGTELENLDSTTIGIATTRRTLIGFNRLRTTTIAATEVSDTSEALEDNTSTELDNINASTTDDTPPTRRTFVLGRLRTTTTEAPVSSGTLNEETITKLEKIDNSAIDNTATTRRTFAGLNRLRTTTITPTEATEIPEEETGTEPENLDSTTVGIETTRQTLIGFNRLRTTTNAATEVVDTFEALEGNTSTELDNIDASTTDNTPPTRRTIVLSRLRTTTTEAPVSSGTLNEEAITKLEKIDNSAIDNTATTRRTFAGLNRLRTTTIAPTEASEAPESFEIPKEETDTEVEYLDTTTRRTFAGFNRLRTTTASPAEASEVSDEEADTELEKKNASTTGNIATTRRTYTGINRLRTTTKSSETSEAPEAENGTELEKLDESQIDTSTTTRRTLIGFNRLRIATTASTESSEASETTEEKNNSELDTNTTAQRTFGLNRLRNTTFASTKDSEAPEEGNGNAISVTATTRRTFSGFNRLRTTTATPSEASEASEASEEEDDSTLSVIATTRRTLVGFNRRRTTTATPEDASKASELPKEETDTTESTATTRRTFGGFNRLRTTISPPETSEVIVDLEEDENDSPTPSTTRRNLVSFNRFRSTTAPTLLHEGDDQTAETEDEDDNAIVVSSRRPFVGINIVRTTTESATTRRSFTPINRLRFSSTTSSPDESEEYDENEVEYEDQEENEATPRSAIVINRFTNAQQQKDASPTRFQLASRQNLFNRNKILRTQSESINEDEVDAAEEEYSDEEVDEEVQPSSTTSRSFPALLNRNQFKIENTLTASNEDNEGGEEVTDEEEEQTPQNIVALLNRNRFRPTQAPAITPVVEEENESDELQNEEEDEKPKLNLLQLRDRIKIAQLESDKDTGVISTRLQQILANRKPSNLTTRLNNLTNQTTTNFTVDTIVERTHTNPLSLTDANLNDDEYTELGQDQDSEPEDSIVETNSNLSTNTPNLNRRFQRVQFNRTAGRRRPTTTTTTTTTSTTTTTTTTDTQVNPSLDDVVDLTSTSNLGLTSVESGTSEDADAATSTEAVQKPRRRFRVLKFRRPLNVNNSLSVEINNSTNTTTSSTESVDNLSLGLELNSTINITTTPSTVITPTRRFRKVIRKLRPVVNRTVLEDESSTVINDTVKPLNVAELLSTLYSNDTATTVSVIEESDNVTTTTDGPTSTTNEETTLGLEATIFSEPSETEVTVSDNTTSTTAASPTPRRLLVNRRPYRPTKPSINAITSTESSSTATPKTYVRKFNRNFKAIRPPTDAANGIGFIQQSSVRPQTGFQGRNRFNFPGRTSSVIQGQQEQNEDNNEDEEDYDEEEDVNEEGEDEETPIERPVIRTNTLINQNQAQDQANEGPEYEDEEPEEEESEERGPEAEEEEEVVKPQVSYRPSNRPSFNRPVNSPFAPNRPAAPGPANRYALDRRPSNKPRVVNRPALITLPPNLIDSDKSTVPTSITPPSVFISTNTRSYERKYSATSTETVPQDLSNPLLEDLNIDALNARNKKIFEVNSKKHTTTIKPKIIHNQPQSSLDTTDTPSNNLDTSTVFDDDEDNNLINSQDDSQVLTSTTEGITEQPIPASEGVLISYSPKKKVVAINRVVEINSKEDKLRRKSKDEQLKTVESTELRSEGLPKFEPLGEISRVKYVHLVDGSSILVDSHSSVTDYTATESSVFVRNTIPVVEPDSLENTRIEYEAGSTSAPVRNSIPDMDYSNAVVESVSAFSVERKSKAITVPEVIADVVEASTISLEGLFDSSRQAKKISEVANEVNGIFYAYSLGEVPTTPRNEKPTIVASTPSTTPLTTTPPTTTTQEPTTTTTTTTTTSTTTTSTTPPPTTIELSAETTIESTTVSPTVPSTTNNRTYTRPIVPLLRPESNESPLVRTATIPVRRPVVRRRLFTTAQPAANASNDGLNTDRTSTISTIKTDDDVAAASTTSTTGLFKYNRRTRPSYLTTISAKLKPTPKVLSSSLTSSNPGEISTTGTAAASSNDITFVTVNKLSNQKFPSGVIRRKFIRPLNANRSTTTTTTTTASSGSASVAVPSDEVANTVPPRTQNPLFKRRFPFTTTAAPVTTIPPSPIEFNTSPLYLDTLIPEDIDQIAKSSIQDTKFLHNQIGDNLNEADHSPVISISTSSIFSSTTPFYSSTYEEPITKRLGIAAITRRPSLRRPQKTTPIPEKAAIFISRRRPHKTPAPFSKIIESQTPGRTYKPVIDYDYYDDGDERVVDKPTASQVKVVLHGKGIIECLDQGNFPHPLSCRKFISCAKFETGGVVGWEYTCPKGLSYDPVGGICNWAAGLGCKE